MTTYSIDMNDMEIHLIDRMNYIVDGLREEECWVVVPDDLYAALRKCLSYNADHRRYLRFKDRNVISEKQTCQINGIK